MSCRDVYSQVYLSLHITLSSAPRCIYYNINNKEENIKNEIVIIKLKDDIKIEQYIWRKFDNV